MTGCMEVSPTRFLVSVMRRPGVCGMTSVSLAPLLWWRRVLCSRSLIASCDHHQGPRTRCGTIRSKSSCAHSLQWYIPLDRLLLSVLHRKKNEPGSIWYAHGKVVIFRHIYFLPLNNVKLIPKNVKVSKFFDIENGDINHVSGSEKDIFEIRIGLLRSCCLAFTYIRFSGFFDTWVLSWIRSDVHFQCFPKCAEQGKGE